ncbi:MAG: PSD1 and planctomycete cytochrome C domain-containing protein [Fuerstiella sp.]
MLFRLLPPLLLVMNPVVAAKYAGAAEGVSFSRDVLPILADRCFHCHGPDAAHREADLRLDQQTSAFADRGDYSIIVPGKPDASELLVRITSDNPDVKMPPPDSHRKQLTGQEIQVLRRWIMEGAEWGRHWSFEKPIRPPVPGGAKHPIDAFVRQRLQQADLPWSPEASKRTLIRRVSLDLTGLPPTAAEVRDFLNDESPDAWDQLVDRLLASPGYGERMAWPWLDAARYADTGGFQGDPDRTMWPWRDWVVEALNGNMPFDQFTLEQLAGDLLPDATAKQQLATGFNRNHMHNSEGGRIAEETRVENVFDRVETTGTVWLGLTLQCARCHDHKFDPTSNRDYFAFYDFFNQTSEEGRTDRSTAVPPALDYTTPVAGAVKVMVMDTREQPRDTYILVKGIYNDVTDRRVTADVPGMLPPLPPKPDRERYTRLDLARWIVSPQNPLTARVTVNRYWQTFFGQGLVNTPSDFGLQGARPTHPELLDWLAVEFVESGWNVKHIHRLIVTSDTYRQSSRVTPEMLSADPTNRLLSRAPRHRMPSWMLRDQALAVSGLLSDRLGGPPVRPYQPDGIWAEATFGKKKYQQDTGELLYRRSLYTFWRRIVGPTMFFDAAKRQTCEVQPNLTNTPLHALTTLNDVTYVEAARVLAERVLQQHADSESRIAAAFETLTARRPEPEEMKLLQQRLDTLTAEFRSNPDQATELLQIGQSPRDKSLTLSEHAAFTALCNLLLNLDEVLVKP